MLMEDYNIIIPDDSFNFNSLNLSTPMSIQGGAFFTKLTKDTNDLYIQTPKCSTKQGFIKSGKKLHTDLLFDKSNETFIQWIENLETKMIELIYEKREKWFQEQIDYDDIENAFSNTLKSYKSGNYNAMRVMVDSPRMLQASNVVIYDQQEHKKTMDDINSTSSLVTILQFHGVKFTAKSFQIYVQIKQCMIMQNNIFNTCKIKLNNNNNKNDEELVEKVSLSLNSEKNIEDDNSEESNNGENEEIVEEKNEEIFEEQKEEIIEEQKEDNEENNNNMKIELSEIDNIDDESKEDTENKENTDIDTISNNDEISENTDVLKVETEQIETPISVYDSLEEFDLSVKDDNLETITLRKPNEIYHDMFVNARNKARAARKTAMLAYLEAKNIKSNYMLDDEYSSDEEYERQIKQKPEQLLLEG